MNNDSTIQEGDIFYFELNKRHYFMQVIHITTGLPAPYDSKQFNYGYFIVVFEKSYRKLPDTVEELNLETIYRVKTKPRKTLLYISNWRETSGIGILPNTINFEKNAGVRIRYFGNKPVAKKFEPELSYQFTLPVRSTTNQDGIEIAPISAGIGYLFDRIRDDQAKQQTKTIVPKYFNDWSEFVDAKAILKTEASLTKFEKATGNKEKALRTCVVEINRLEDKLNFITTIEAENLFDLLIELSVKSGLAGEEAVRIIDEVREW